jgi:hypothetical protein
MGTSTGLNVAQQRRFMTYDEGTSFVAKCHQANQRYGVCLDGTGPIGNDVLQQASAPSSRFYGQNCGGCGYTKLEKCRVNGKWGIDSLD